ncbi:MAG: hypothetical protein ACK4GD_04885 [Sphingomonadaceae bacterium]
MNHYRKALLLGGVLIAIAVLAVFDIIPEEIAQYAPLAVVPFVISGQRSCHVIHRERRA